MTPTLFPTMAQEAFRPLRAALGTDRKEADYSPDEVRNLLYACGFGAAVLDKLREMFQAFLRRGMESRKLHFLVKEFMDVLELARDEVYPKVRAITAGGALPAEERSSSLGSLDEFSRNAAAVQAELATLQRWLEAPPPDIDLAAILAEKAAAQPVPYDDLDDILRKLTAGGDL